MEKTITWNKAQNCLVKVINQKQPCRIMSVQQRKLYEKIGQLTVERDFLKKAGANFHGSNDEN